MTMETTTTPLRLAIADDHALFREGLRSILEVTSDIVVAAETDRVDSIVPMLAATPCDILLLDLQMDRNSLIDIRSLATRVKVIVVTASEDADQAMTAIRAGAYGVVFKRFAAETLKDAIRAAANDQTWMPPPVQSRLAGELREPGREPLTAREREIVRHVAQGLRNAEVGKRLFITEETVKAHLNNIFQKLRVRDRVQLTLYALRSGIVGLEDTPER
jgi:two-component system NarL family response regulator